MTIGANSVSLIFINTLELQTLYMQKRRPSFVQNATEGRGRRRYLIPIPSASGSIKHLRSMQSNIEENISKARDFVYHIASAYFVWINLQKEEYNNLYKKDKYFWGIVLVSLQTEFLLGLTKIFEKRKSNDVLSMHYLLTFLSEEDRKKIKSEISKLEPVIKHLTIWRQNFLAHHNIFFTHHPQELFKKFPIKNSELEALVDLSKETLAMIHSAATKEKHGYMFDAFKEGSQTDTENIMKKLKLAYEIEAEQRKTKYGL